MGEEAKQEQVPVEVKPAEEKKEEKAEEIPAEEKKEEPPLQPPSPCVLHVDLHCMGCAKKIEKSIMKIRGVEGVVIAMAKNEVTIKGVVEPQAICSKIMKTTKRKARVVSPLPAAEGEPIPEVVSSQVVGLTTVELHVNMHCEACAEQLKKKIMQMRGVQTAATEFSSGKVTVTGTMDANKLVDYVYRRTRKQARIVPQPEPEAEKKEENKEGEKPAEEAKPGEESADKKEDGKAASAEEGKTDNGEGDKENYKGENGCSEEMKVDDRKEVEGVTVPVPVPAAGAVYVDEENMKRMMYYHAYPPPLYVIERVPAPQLFSDENPNACCIS